MTPTLRTTQFFQQRRTHQECEMFAAELETELAAMTAERDDLHVRMRDIMDATFAAIDESCDCNERHCSCVPLLRAEVKRLLAERDDARCEAQALRDAYNEEILPWEIPASWEVADS